MSIRHLNYSEILNVILWISHYLCIWNFKAVFSCWLMGETRLWRFWQARAASDLTPFVSGRFWPQFLSNENMDESMSVGKSGPTTASIGSQSKHLTTRHVICAQMVAQKQLCSPFCCVLSRQFPKKCLLGKALQRCAWRHLNCTWKFHKSLGGVYPLEEQPNQAPQSGSFNCHQSIIWQRRLSKIGLIKKTFS